MAISLPFDLPANLKSMQPYLEMATDYESKDPCISYWCRLYVLKQGFILKRVEDDLSFLLVLMEVLGKNKQDLQSKIETTDIPVARAHLEGVVQKLLSWAENVPPLESLTNVVAKAFQSAGMLLDVCSIFGEPNEGESEKKKCTDPPEDNTHSEFHSGSTKKKSNVQYQDIGKLSGGISGELPNDEKKNQAPSSTTTDEGENLAQTPKVSKPVWLLERKKIYVYDHLFLLELRNHPASLKRPEELPSLDIVRNKIGRNKMIADEIYHQQSQLKPNANPHCFDNFSQKNNHGGPCVVGTEAGQVPPRLPLVSGHLGPTSPITKTKPQQVPVTTPTKAQPRLISLGGSWRERSSSLRIVDPIANRDIMTGEEAPRPAMVSPTTSTPPILWQSPRRRL
ncbi:uncharacterized protein LOC124192568 isoform X3 [Daphnia pulex]|uniref:uncharacterized protein LOC124192568 isoform X3 n=1 Tax=Daphnia pulex TaxID=6669 RepID=UPI001EDD4529|nr:uncharacterized protein LOC124192568 isoform X3 [Daphnia pulex]